MSWTAPKTWTAGEPLTKADFDAQIRDNELVLHDPVASMLPKPIEAIVGASAAIALPANDDLAHLGVIIVPRPITVKEIQYNIGAGGGATSAIRIALYTEDGQTKLMDEVDTCGAGTGVRTSGVSGGFAAITNFDLEAGNYIIWIGHSVYNTSAKTVYRYTYDTTLEAHVGGEADLSGTLTIAGGVGAAPATITIDGFTSVAGALIPVVRFLGLA